MFGILHNNSGAFIFQVKIALVGILAGSSGLDLSAAQNVVFLELPETISDFQQVVGLKSH